MTSGTMNDQVTSWRSRISTAWPGRLTMVLRMTGSLIVASAMLSCASSDREERRWTEDVEMDDGRVIQVERHVVFNETNALGGGAYNAVESKAILSFLGDLKSLPAWDVPLIPLVLYRDKEADQWVIVANTTSCEVWRSRGRPIPMYWEFRTVDGAWIEVPVSDRSVGRQTNLLFRYSRGDVPDHISLAEKQLRQSAHGIAHDFLEILERPKSVAC